MYRNALFCGRQVQNLPGGEADFSMHPAQKHCASGQPRTSAQRKLFSVSKYPKMARKCQKCDKNGVFLQKKPVLKQKTGFFTYFILFSAQMRVQGAS
ncbi:MAG: hypothetical protein DSY55_04420 [Clostridia bacterium]|nr:MAG: hypothetical protein DSY55_04420 [Clostridia bacterium]